MKLFGACVVLLACFILSHVLTAQESHQKEDSDAKDKRFPDGLSHDFGKVAYGAHVKHTFRIVNTSDSPVEITSVRLSAGRQVKASMDISKLNPKEVGKLLVA